MDWLEHAHQLLVVFHSRSPAVGACVWFGLVLELYLSVRKSSEKENQKKFFVKRRRCTEEESR